MTKKRIYVIKVGGISEIFSEEEEEAYKLWKLLSNSKLKILKRLWQASYKDQEKFCWPSDIEVELHSIVIDMYLNETLAHKSYFNLEEIRKMKLIKNKKKT